MPSRAGTKKKDLHTELLKVIESLKNDRSILIEHLDRLPKKWNLKQSTAQIKWQIKYFDDIYYDLYTLVENNNKYRSAINVDLIESSALAKGNIEYNETIISERDKVEQYYNNKIDKVCQRIIRVSV